MGKKDWKAIAKGLKKELKAAQAQPAAAPAKAAKPVSPLALSLIHI